MDELKRYIGYVLDDNEEIHLMTDLNANELCTYVTHFGRFGNIRIYDRKQEEYVLLTHGVYLTRFYPDVKDRQFANERSVFLFEYFNDYKQQLKLVYPKGRLKKIYKQYCVQNESSL